MTVAERPYVNELRPEFVSAHAFNAFLDSNTPSRSTMMTSHLSQHLVINGSEPSRTLTMAEHEFGKYTLAQKMPATGKILEIVQRYPKGVGQNDLALNPETTVIYFNEDTKEIDCFSITDFSCYHQFFGFANVQKPGINQVYVGSHIKKDTVFTDTIANSEHRVYGPGLNLATALISDGSVAEDAVKICRSALPKLAFKIYETRTVEVGGKCFPIYLYGDKLFPDIGEFVRPDGAVMGTRDYNEDYAPVEMGYYDVRKVNDAFDKLYYAREEQISRLVDGTYTYKPGRVVDIQVVANNDNNRNLPPSMAAPFEKYAKALKGYYQRLLDAEKRLTREHYKKFGDNNIRFSGQLSNLLVLARVMTNTPLDNKQSAPLNLNVNRAPVDEFRITFTIEYEITPNIGFKITGMQGDKGIISAIEDPENMPVDKEGNRAEIILSSDSTGARNNVGRLFYQYFNAAARDTSKRIRAMLGLSQNCILEDVQQIPEKKFQDIYSYLLGYYERVSDVQFRTASQYGPDDQREHMWDVVRQGIYNVIPIGNPISRVTSFRLLERDYPQCYGPITMKGANGEIVTSVEDVTIGDMYFLLLDKIADDNSSVATGRLQHFGVLSLQTGSSKYISPFRESPTRTIGNDEYRILLSYCGRLAIAEMMDRSNNPLAQRNITYNILKSRYPTNIDRIVDRYVVPLGSTRPLQLVKHSLLVGGTRMTYVPNRLLPEPQYSYVYRPEMNTHPRRA